MPTPFWTLRVKHGRSETIWTSSDESDARARYAKETIVPDMDDLKGLAGERLVVLTDPRGEPADAQRIRHFGPKWARLMTVYSLH